MKLVVNASPLILLIAVDHLSILHDLAEQVVVPRPVLREIEAGVGRDEAADLVRSTRWISVAESAPAPPALAAWNLGAGETAVLSWAQRHDGFTCVLDDRAARTASRAIRVPVVGTLGLVLAAKEAGQLSAARPILERMIDVGFYIGDRILEDALRMVGE